MIDSLLAIFARKGYIVYTRPFELNIAGVRNSDAQPNRFDDTLHVFYQREDGRWILHSFRATTDPGTYWLKNLMNPKGTAILKPGQYIHSHRIGVHRGKYQALVQQKPVTVWRDGNKDAVADIGSPKEDTGLFGINIHRAKPVGTTENVNDHSAGCQVLADVKDFHLLMQLAQRHKLLYGNNFTYTLLQSGDWEG